jgi:hypothetical protein
MRLILMLKSFYNFVIMIKMTEEGVAYSPLKMPNLNAAVYPHVHYTHVANRTSATTMNLSVTVRLEIVENVSKKEHKLMNGTSKFKFETDEGLNLESVYKTFRKSFFNVYHTFLKFQEQKRMPKMDIAISNKEGFEENINPILKMFNETPYIPDNIN